MTDYSITNKLDIQLNPINDKKPLLSKSITIDIDKPTEPNKPPIINKQNVNKISLEVEEISKD